MPGGSGRKLIAEQAGAALPGAFAAPAGKAVKASAKPIPTVIALCIVLSPVEPRIGGRPLAPSPVS
jgi:hypothetical protein